jgi:starch phosphorylase
MRVTAAGGGDAAIHRHHDVDGYGDLAELALDMRWSWNHRTDGLWRSLDGDLWNLTKNPWIVLQTASRDQIRHVLEDPALRQQVTDLLRSKRLTEAAPAWFQQHHAGDPLTCIAYFSMEFMLSEALPIYSGGLGNVAGDQLKTASDLGVPVVGVGLLYQRGYFRQVIDQDGAQQALYPYNDPGQLPITPLRQANGEWLRLEIALPGYSVWLRAWQVQVGRVKLYLLDSNDPANHPAHRTITSDLYGGDPEMRLKQELALGIGGWRLLEAIGLRPEVCHLNEGHAAFAVLERARSFMRTSGQSFDVALAVTRVGNLFTTHTAVAAGFDRYPPGLVARYLSGYAVKLGLDFAALLALGRRDERDAEEPFNMAYLAMRGSGSVNGVSRLHGQVSRHLFEPIFPGWPSEEVPVGHVTNGVHMPSWDSVEADDLWTNACGKDRWLGTMDRMEQDLRQVPDAKLWACRCAARSALVSYAREHLARQLAASGAASTAIAAAKSMLDPHALTLGFARRFATYKRPDLLLHDRDRLLRILNRHGQPVQLILAGKAHPADHAGQALIQEWTRFIRDTDARAHVIFLDDYDMRLSEQLVQGVDVWINTPRRPWEACGTSGMKVLVNGGLNLSELDGWWAEAYTPAVGWALGDGQEHGDDPAWDASEANALYELLERAVIPEFHARDHAGIPVAWVARMRESMARLTPAFSANRTVREYTDEHYLPAAAAYRLRAGDHGDPGRAIIAWRHRLDQNWARVRFGAATSVPSDGRHDFDLKVFLQDLEPAAVRVELYAMGVAGGAAVRQEMTPVQARADPDGAFRYRATVTTSRPAGDFTGRVMPRFAGVAVPAEEARITWQR